jgi:hypothetical protein
MSYVMILKTGTSPGGYTVDSLEFEYVEAAYNMIPDGGMLRLPPGEATWNSTLNITKSIKIIGAGTGYPDSGDDATTIKYSGSTYAILIQPSNPAAEPLIDISGITFDGESGNRYGLYIVNTSEPSGYHNFRIHHNAFKNFGISSEVAAIRTYGYVYGLIDNNYFNNNRLDFNFSGYGYAAWSQYDKDSGEDTLDFDTLGLGGADFIFAEDNISVNVNYRNITSGTGSRWVARYNNFSYASAQQTVDMHGDMQNASVIAGEFYNNTITKSVVGWLLLFAYRGGTALIFNNNITFTTDRVYINLEEENNDYEPPKVCNYLMGNEADGYYNMKIHNGYMWSNMNNATENTWIHHRGAAGTNFTTDIDPSGCLTPSTDYWSDTKDDSASAQDLFTFTKSETHPVTCVIGDALWDTATNKLYKCNATNVWTEIYAPYTYPHPLRGE